MKQTSFSFSKSEISNLYPGMETLGVLLGQLEKEAQTRGEVICEIQVNGKSILNDEAAAGLLPLGDVESLSITAQKPIDLLAETISSACEYLDRLVVALEKNAFLFRGNDLKKAHEFHRSCIEGTQWFVQMVSLFKSAYENAYQQSLNGWAENERELAQILKTVLEAFNSKNLVLMADLIEYDLLNTLQKWREELDTINRKFNGTQGSPSR